MINTNYNKRLIKNDNYVIIRSKKERSGIRLKIVLVNEEYPKETNFGGIATYQKIVAEEYVRQGHKVTVICRGINKYQNYTENGVNIIRVFQHNTHNKKKDYIEYRKKIRDILINMQNNNEIDIIETPDWGAETIFYEPKRKVPLVVRLHTPLKIWLKYNKNNFGNITKKMLRWEKHLIENADLVTCCSHSLLNEMKKDFKIIDKAIVTPNPANLNNFYRDNNIKKENKLLYVGSVEERKGVIVLAKALNIVFKKIPNLKVEFIGKDTTRNNKNISSFEYIKSIVDNKYINNIKFCGQLDNSEVMYHMNTALIGVYPSLFDNFPYVILESMATGLQIVGSSNSGMVEMLDKYGSIYDAGNEYSLAEKILERYEIAKQENTNQNVIKRVNEKFNAKTVCTNTIDLYKTTYSKYYKKNINNSEILKICKDNFQTDKYKIKLLNKKQLANIVYLLKIKNKKYILKKYNYNYDFCLSNRLYKLCENNNISIIKPLNKNTIKVNDDKYNIFPYVKNKFTLLKPDKFFNDYLKVNRITKGKNEILNKMDNYSKLIKKINYKDSILENEINDILYIYDNLDKYETNKEVYINHGDISKNNMIYNKQYYLIDFDEANIGWKLYDLAVIIIKNYTKKDKICMKKVNKLLVKNQISEKELNNIIKMYLCKILLEKFYLHLIGKIDLFDKMQKKDDYIRYYKILINMG